MNDQQINQLTAAIDRLGNGIAILVFVSIVLGSCVANMATDKIATEIHDSGRVVAHEIESKRCK